MSDLMEMALAILSFTQSLIGAWMLLASLKDDLDHMTRLNRLIWGFGLIIAAKQP